MVPDDRGMEHDEHPHKGHSFAMDVHPERYSRESLSRLEEGILEDDQKRHSHDELGDTVPDLENRIDDSRNLSRTLMVCGSLLLIFAYIVVWWVGWDVRSGNELFSAMLIISIIIAVGLIVWGAVERQRIVRLLSRMHMPAEDGREQIRREREFREGDRAA